MWIKCRGYLIGGIIGFIIAWLLSYGILHKSLNANKLLVSTPEKTIEVKLVTKIDTLKIAHDVYKTDTVKVPTLLKQDTVFVDNSKIVQVIPKVVRTYQDSVKVEDSVYVGYKAKVTGSLDNINLSYSNRKSIVVIHKTDSVNTITTIVKPNTGLYLGLTGGYQEVSPSLQYIRDSNSFGVKYNLVNKGVGVTYSRKIF